MRHLKPTMGYMVDRGSNANTLKSEDVGVERLIFSGSSDTLKSSDGISLPCVLFYDSGMGRQEFDTRVYRK